MTSRRALATFAAVLFAVGMWIGAARAASPAGTAAPSATVTAVPPAVLFGDAFELRAEVRLPPGAGAGAAVLLDPAPFTALAPARSTSRRGGGATVVTVTARVACLSAACLPEAKSRTVQAGRVSVRTGGRTVAVPGAGVQVRVSGRVPAALAREQDGGYRTDAATPRRTWGIAPGALVAILLGGAAVLVLGALGLLWPDARARLAGVRARPGDTDAFRHALRLLRESAQRSAPDRRRAADLVARLTGARGDDAIAGGALRLAWGRPEPAPEDAMELADRAEAASRAGGGTGETAP